MTQAVVRAGGNWRIYSHQWMFAYTSELLGSDGRDECVSVFAERWAGKVHDEDAEIVPVSKTAPDRHPYLIRLRLPNLVQESRERPAEVPDGARLVQAHSPQEQELLDYGRKMLRR